MRTFIVGEMRAAKFDQFRGAGLCAELENDQCLWRLAPFFIGHRDDHHLVDTGMSEQYLLDCERRNVLAPADDDVFFPVHNMEIVVGIDGSDVSRVEPAAFHRRGRRLGLSPIAGHHTIAARNDLTHRNFVVDYFVSFRVEHTQLYSGDREARHRLPFITFLSGPGDIRLYSGLCQCWTSFGEAVTRDTGASQLFFYPLNKT